MGQLSAAVDVLVKGDSTYCEDDGCACCASWVVEGFFHGFDGLQAQPQGCLDGEEALRDGNAAG